jgi:hypothetical protein
MINFNQDQQQQFNELLNEAFNNAQTFNQHKNQSKMKQRKQHEAYLGDDFVINYIIEFTEWAGDRETPPATECQITEAELIADGKGTLKLPDGFIESFLESKLLNI